MTQRADKARIYNSRKWKKMRERKLEANPLCELCLQRDGRAVAARCVHHKTPIETARTFADMEVLAFNWDNLQALCYDCHSAVHKALRSRSREGHQRAMDARLARFAAKHKPVRSTDTPGGSFFPEGAKIPKSTTPPFR